MKPFPLILSAALLLQLHSNAQQAGMLDTTFGSGAKAFMQFNNSGASRAVLVQSDSSIVLVGSTSNSGSKIALVRYDRHGNVDNSYGTAGKIEQVVGGFGDGGTTAIIQPDDKVVVGGYAYNVGGLTNDDFTLIRYKKNGTPDSSFGTNGIKRHDIGGGLDRIWGLAIQPDGKLVAVGEKASTVAPYEYALVVTRYKTNGQLDSSFATNGIFITGLPNTNIVGRDVAMQPDGKIVVAAVYANMTTGPKNFYVGRLTVAGVPDASFGTGGFTSTLVALDAQSQSVVVQPDGKIILGGTSNDAGRGYFTMVRYTSSGSPDNTFGNAGIVKSAIGNTSWGMGVHLQPDNKILLTGYGRSNVDTPNKLRFLLARYKPDGNFDSSFGTNGTVFTDMGSNSAYANGIALQKDGKILLSGSSNFMGGFAVARYWPESVPVQPNNIPGTIDHEMAMLYPNPATDMITLQYNLQKPAAIALNIYDISGRLVKVLTTALRPAGSNKTLVDITDLPRGKYHLQLKHGAVVETIQFLKQ